MIYASLTWTPRNDAYAEPSWPVSVVSPAADPGSLRVALAERLGMPANSIRLSHVVWEPIVASFVSPSGTPYFDCPDCGTSCEITLVGHSCFS